MASDGELLDSNLTANRCGYSLAELTVALLVMAIASAVAIPRWNQSFQQRQLRAAGETLASDLRLAIRSAAARSQIAEIRFTLNTSTMQVTPSLGISDSSNAASSETVDYAVKFKSVKVSAISCDGATGFKIDTSGRLIHPVTLAPLSTARITLRMGSDEWIVDALKLFSAPSSAVMRKVS